MKLKIGDIVCYDLGCDFSYEKNLFGYIVDIKRKKIYVKWFYTKIKTTVEYDFNCKYLKKVE